MAGLGQVGDGLSHFRGEQLPLLHAAIENTPGLGLQNTGDDLEQCRLARAAGPGQRDQLAGLNVGRDREQRRIRVFLVAQRDPTDRHDLGEAVFADLRIVAARLGRGPHKTVQLIEGRTDLCQSGQCLETDLHRRQGPPNQGHRGHQGACRHVLVDHLDGTHEQGKQARALDHRVAHGLKRQHAHGRARAFHRHPRR